MDVAIATNFVCFIHRNAWYRWTQAASGAARQANAGICHAPSFSFFRLLLFTTHTQWCVGDMRGYTAYTNLWGFFWQRILTSVIVNKQGTFRPFATPVCVYPPPFLAIQHCVGQEVAVQSKASCKVWEQCAEDPATKIQQVKATEKLEYKSEETAALLTLQTSPHSLHPCIHVAFTHYRQY